MNWQNANKIDENKYEFPSDWLKIEYFEALNILFRVENSLRMFVFIILKNEFFEKWKDLSVTSDDEESSTISAIAKKRLFQDKNYAYLGYVLNSPFMHLTSGELIRIITSDSYWKLFKPYFLGSKEIIKNKLDEIGNVRNSVAHFRPIKKGDVELIKQNSLHTLSEIEKTLRDFIYCPDIVPTNTDEEWYKELKGINSNECEITFTQSKKEEWVKLRLHFESPIIEINNSTYFSHISAFNLKTNNILAHNKDLSKYVISLTEVLPYFYTLEPEKKRIIKTINFTFSRKCISSNFSTIKKQLETILLQISNEIALIQKDNLARGKLIEVLKFYLERDSAEEYYSLKKNPFKTELEENSPVEFWGSINYSSDDFITDAENFPWMPINISDSNSLPF